jgi:hypothetical protein
VPPWLVSANPAERQPVALDGIFPRRTGQPSATQGQHPARDPGCKVDCLRSPCTLIGSAPFHWGFATTVVAVVVRARRCGQSINAPRRTVCGRASWASPSRLSAGASSLASFVERRPQVSLPNLRLHGWPLRLPIVRPILLEFSNTRAQFFVRHFLGHQQAKRTVDARIDISRPRLGAGAVQQGGPASLPQQRRGVESGAAFFA